jgi:hypothetical protein
MILKERGAIFNSFPFAKSTCAAQISFTKIQSERFIACLFTLWMKESDELSKVSHNLLVLTLSSAKGLFAIINTVNF